MKKSEGGQDNDIDLKCFAQDDHLHEHNFRGFIIIDVTFLLLSCISAE